MVLSAGYCDAIAVVIEKSAPTYEADGHFRLPSWKHLEAIGSWNVFTNTRPTPTIAQKANTPPNITPTAWAASGPAPGLLLRLVLLPVLRPVRHLPGIRRRCRPTKRRFHPQHVALA